MEETERIKFDVIGLCETKRRNPLSCTWRNGAGVFLGSRKDNSTSGGIASIIAGDFNAYVGPKRPYEAFIGPHSLEERNEAGELLASFCETSHFYHGNSRFQKAKNRRWTYISPNGVQRHELDHILCNRKVFTDVAVVPSFQTGSDHRLLRAKFHFDNTRALLDRIAHRRLPPTILDAEAAERLAEMHDFEELDAIDEGYDKLVAAITTIRDSCRRGKPNHINSRITEETRQLLEKRRNLKRTTHSHLEMTLLNRLGREKVARDHEEFTRRRKGLWQRRNHGLASSWPHVSRTPTRYSVLEGLRRQENNVATWHGSCDRGILRAAVSLVCGYSAR
ncbi:hypothetical protein Aduo_009080 [Ancylostoma duodenale]